MAGLVVENVSVDFTIYGLQRNFRQALFQRATGGFLAHEGRHNDRVVVKALKNISFELKDGDRLGLVGHNGAGKSTLLRVLAGAYEPTEGRVLVDGKLTPLFDMLPGLDAEDTGYDNIVSSGMLFGLSRREIEAIIPEVEEVSELGEYLSLPVRTYSSGMTTRLGFALATAMHPGILLMDEGIGAGDARFAERAVERLRKFVDRSRIVVLASHSNALLASMCDKAALMQGGQITDFGPIGEVLERYDEFVRRGKLQATSP